MLHQTDRRRRPSAWVAAALAAVVVGVGVGVGGGATARAGLITDPSAIGPNPNVITFETGSTALPVVPGVTFPDTSTLGSGPLLGGVAEFTYNHQFFGNQEYGNLSTFRGYTSLEVDFAGPVAGAGAYLQGIFNSTGYATAVTTMVYGLDGSLLDQRTTQIPFSFTSKPTFVGFTEAAGISRIVWVPNNGFFAVDNVTYSAAVPEPGSSTLLAIAAALGLGCRRFLRPKPARAA